MASSKIKGITVEIGGDTTKLGKAIADSEKQTRSLQGELRQVEKLLQFDPGNTELLAQKQQILTEAVKETTEKLNTLREAEAQVVEQFNKGDIGEDQLRAFQREIIKTQSELDGFESALNDTGDNIEDVGNSAEQSSDGFTVMKGALADLVSNVIQSAVGAIGDLIGSLFELSEATEEYRQMQAKIEGSADTFGYSAEFATGKYKEFYKYLGDDQMATNAITNLMGLGTSTESVSKLAEGAIGVWASYGDSIPVEGLTEAINETIQCGKVTGTFADTINWAKDSNEQLKSALGGNKDAQKAFTQALKDGETAEDAFNAGLSKITDQQERADVVAKFLNSTYGESKSKYDEMSGSILDANEAELKLKDTQAQLGEAMAPINTAFTNFKAQALEAITPLIKSLADGFMNLLNWLKEHPVAMGILTGIVTALAVAFGILAGSLMITGIINAVTYAIGLLGGAFTILTSPISLIVIAIAGLVAGFLYLWNNCEAFRNFFINLWSQIKTAIQPILDALVNAFKMAWEWIKGVWNQVQPYFAQIWESIKSVFSVVGQFLSAYFKLAWELIKVAWSMVVPYFRNVWNTIKVIFSVVATYLGGMFRTAWEAIKLVWNTVTGFFRNIWNTIKGIFSVVKNVLSGNWRGAWEAIKGIVSGWTSYFSGIWNGIKNVFASVKTWFSTTFSTAWNGIKSVFSGWGSFFKELWNKVKSAFKISNIVDIGKNIVEGIWNGIKGATNWLIGKIKGFCSDALGAIKGFFGIESPSRVMRDEVGRFISEGIGVGITENAKKPITALRTIGDDMVDNADSLNGATIGRKLTATFGGVSSTTANNDLLLNKLDRIYDRLNRLQIVLDTDTLVGETVDKMDRALADKQLLNARGG